MPDPPLFVGGTGRSGTHAVAKLLGKHSHLYYVSRELRFHTDRGGLPDLFEGQIDVDKFLSNMREYYWRRPGADGRVRGLHSKFKKKRFEAALDEFEILAQTDVRAAGAALLRALLDPMAAEEGKPVWIEQTPQTASAAGYLNEMFPDMRMIHMVRDGRDVASSVNNMPWGPGSMRGGLRWWEKRLRAADAGVAKVPGDRVLVMSLEDLVVNDRESSYERLLGFLGVDDERKVRKHFDKQLVADHANIGRWRRDMSERRQRRVDRAYERALQQMAADGVRSIEALEGSPAA
ncbi:MAG: hypothetical protein QOG62_1719 [Thermoleophilaceae bacterium]|jgi:hypothetical protein|nr:hypothetical protein [Thermoleophilaceae bacterium]